MNAPCRTPGPPGDSEDSPAGPPGLGHSAPRLWSCLGTAQKDRRQAGTLGIRRGPTVGQIGGRGAKVLPRAGSGGADG